MSQEIPPSSLPPARENSQIDADATKDQYSLDEMMKALREQEREKDEKGEVVTRSDGSVARKVKKRKRRSDQPDKPTPEKQKKSLLLKVILVVCLIVALFLGAGFLLLTHNSKKYKEGLETTASEWSGAEVELKGFKRLPFVTRIQSANFEWPETSYLRELKLSRIDGDARFSSLLGARLGGLQLGGSTGQMLVKMPVGSGEVGTSYEEADFPFQFDQYYCEALSIAFGESRTISFKDASTNFRYISNEGGQLTMDQGTFHLEGWRPFPISSGLMRFEDGILDLKLLSLEQPESDDTLYTSNLKISGRIPLAAGSKVHLTTETEHFSLSSLLGKKLSRFFSGAVLESTGDVIYITGEDDFEEIVMRFTADRVKISSFPFLANLGELFPDHQLEDLMFDGGLTDSAISGVIRVRPGGIAIESLEMARKGNVRFRGAVIISNEGKIGGHVNLWLNRVIVASNPRFKDSLLMRESVSSGWVKFNFKLGGTISEPNDTFRTQIGMGAALPGIGSGAKSNEELLWDEISKPDEDLTPDAFKENGQ